MYDGWFEGDTEPWIEIITKPAQVFSAWQLHAQDNLQQIKVHPKNEALHVHMFEYRLNIGSSAM